MLAEFELPSIDALTARMAIIMACAKGADGSFNPGAIAVAIGLVGKPSGPMALMELVMRGVTGTSFCEYWQNVGEDEEPEVLRALAQAFTSGGLGR